MSAAVDARGVTVQEARPALLLVEDSEADVAALQRALQPLGVALVCVASGEEAVKALEHHDFVAVLLDVYLAGAWDGFETARRIRELPGRRAVPLLFMTGAPQDVLMSLRAYRAGGVDLLHKPVFTEQLTAKVSVFLELWHARERERSDLRAREQQALRKREEEYRFLAEASALLGNSLDSVTTLQQLARLAVSTLADWCVVELVDERGRIECLAVTHADADSARHLRDSLNRHPHAPDAPRGVARVLRTGEPDWTAHVTEEALRAVTGEDGARLELMRSLGLRSYVIVPLIAGGRVLGAMSLLHAESGRHYTEADVRFAEDLARRAALAVDNARLYQASQEAVRLRDEFLAVASHELRTPLTPIRIKVQALQRQTQAAAGGVLAADKVASVLDTVASQTRRLTNLVDGLLDVSHFSAGRLELNPEPVDLSALLRDVGTAFEADCAKACCPLELHTPEAVVCSVDRRRVEQAVSHLMANAVKYGAGRPIQLRLVADGGHARIRVKDEGIGISPEALPRLFGKFARAVSERHYGGLGLGLYLAREIVEAHGGTIHVESQPGQGACFEVTLPLGQNQT
ncbi:response regulator [Pyxidicoccus parkwayensis]|uniref:histidine kinase n=1 Tax=Pyxidicoccus parkwayensis TaxID=2813578 RepID=A0ABX7NJI7_9BACT|nr:ATP-binding protein [Pyxidicoccus parkwaysis]QSQ18935.1 response regulator [Pyxidicoccus parkwaysis]